MKPNLRSRKFYTRENSYGGSLYFIQGRKDVEFYCDSLLCQCMLSGKFPKVGLATDPRKHYSKYATIFMHGVKEKRGMAGGGFLLFTLGIRLLS